MAREIIDQIRTDPSTQASLGEPLAELIEDPALLAEIADGLKRLDASRVEASAHHRPLAGAADPATRSAP